MKNITISDLFIYPIKSTKGINISSSTVLYTGFEFDRSFGVLNINNEILTARKNVYLLSISTIINEETLILSHPKSKSLEIDLKKENTNSIQISLFKKETMGKLIDNPKLNNWLSNILEEPCKLVQVDTENLRTSDSKTINHSIYYSDCFPIHLVTTASIKDLNSKLETKITDNRYRPNILISGTKPYEEESWKSITIGNCEFEVIMPAERCSLITINPSSLNIDKHQEPLRTLAKNRRGNKKVNFGMYLIPKKIGVIKKGDSIIINR